MHNKAMQVGVIGLGRMGLRHLEVLKKLNMTICGVVDRSVDALAQASHTFNIPQDCCFTQVENLLRTKRPNAVVIATTAPSHAEYTLLCARNQVQYILCEKPMAISLSEAHEMITACKNQGTRLAINHQMMFLPQYTEIKKFINELTFGPIVSILVAGSNFGLAMNASHYFEVFRYLTNSDVTTVQAWFDEEKIPNPRGMEFEDFSGSLLAKNANGTKMYIDFSARAGHGLQVLYIFKHGQVMVDELSGFIRTIARKAEYHHLPTTRYGMPADNHQYEIKSFEMIDSTRMVWEGMLTNKPYPDEKVGEHAMKCLVAAFESNEKNHSEVAINNISVEKAKKFSWA